jgi:hypothetical protein
MILAAAANTPSGIEVATLVIAGVAAIAGIISASFAGLLSRRNEYLKWKRDLRFNAYVNLKEALRNLMSAINGYINWTELSEHGVNEQEVRKLKLTLVRQMLESREPFHKAITELSAACPNNLIVTIEQVASAVDDYFNVVNETIKGPVSKEQLADPATRINKAADTLFLRLREQLQLVV